jgi:trehalose/maltose hydrolase-like predicted phosphorylase
VASNRLPALPPELDRRFEAVVLWSGVPAISARTAHALVALGEAGALVGWLAPAPVDELTERLGPPAPGATLLLADSGGTGAVVVDDSGCHGVGEPLREGDLEALDEAGAALAAILAGRGLAATARARPPGRPSVSVELVSDTVHQPTWSRLKQLLLAHGIPGVPHLADLAVEAARGAGLDEPRVVVEGPRVEISSLDAGDVAFGMLEELWRQGVDPQAVLVVVDGLAGVPHRPAPVTDPDVRNATVALVNGGRGSARSGTVVLTGGAARLRQLLADQLRRRRRRVVPEVATRSGWSLTVEGLDVERERVDESLLTLADGSVGMSGAPLAGDPTRHPWVVAAGVYDGHGPTTHLLTGPVAFEFGERDPEAPLRRVLDLRTGVLHECAGAGTGGAFESVRFASLARPTTAVLRVRHSGARRAGPPLFPPADDPAYDRGRSGDATWMRVAASGGGIAAAATQTRSAGRRPAGERDAVDKVLDRVAVYRADPDVLPDAPLVVEAVGQAATVGFDRLLAEHRRAWAHRWEDADVIVDGDDELQLGVRFALFHLMASVAGSGEAAVGARGLTGTGYSGHVFWDADTFVLPFLAATHPASARAMLEYRLRRLPAAMEAASAAGRSGARFPWESAGTGRDVTPTSARDRSGRLVPIRTGQLEEHIVAEVPWAACCYADWTGDEEFASGPLRRILVETARYWASRIRVEPDGSGHIYGVVGPDEYHEPVDDNAFTNVMARWNLRRAAEATDAAGADLGVEVGEQRRWLELADVLFDGYDADSGIYEQFAGFGRLEPLIIAEVAPHRPIAADLMLGAERTRGAQVIKQADVLMLHHLVPDEVVAGSLEPNLRYYEPRTAHGSSLSPAIHASVLARARDFDRALPELRLASRMDLDDLTGSSALGLHLATMGGVWQALAFGFMGLRPRAGMLHVDPVLPPSWSALELRLRFHGARVRVRKERGHLSIRADRRISVVVGGTPFAVGAGALAFRRRGAKWEPTS